MSDLEQNNTLNKSLIVDNIKLIDIEALKTFKDLLINTTVSKEELQNLIDNIIINEEVTAAALNDLDKRINNLGELANVQAVDTEAVVDDININYATVDYVNGLIGDINSVLDSIISGGNATQQENLITYGILTRAAEYNYFYSEYPVESDITITANWEHPMNGEQTLICHISKGNTKIDETLTAAYEFTNVVISPESDSKYIYKYNK